MRNKYLFNIPAHFQYVNNAYLCWFTFLEERGGFHPLKTKSTHSSYITFEEGGQISSLAKFRQNRSGTLKFGGFAIFYLELLDY